MKVSPYLLLTVLLFSCQTEDQKMASAYTKAIEKAIRDDAFKANQGVQLLEVQYVDRKEILENEYDSLRLAGLTTYRQNLKDVADLELQYANLLIEEASAKSKLATMAHQIPDPKIMQQAKAEIAEHTNRVKSYLDTVQILLNEDSLIRDARFKRANGGDKLYLVRYFQKSTIAGHNFMDTVKAIFTKDLKLKSSHIL